MNNDTFITHNRYMPMQECRTEYDNFERRVTQLQKICKLKRHEAWQREYANLIIVFGESNADAIIQSRLCFTCTCGMVLEWQGNNAHCPKCNKKVYVNGVKV